MLWAGAGSSLVLDALPASDSNLTHLGRAGVVRARMHAAVDMHCTASALELPLSFLNDVPVCCPHPSVDPTPLAPTPLAPPLCGPHPLPACVKP